MNFEENSCSKPNRHTTVTATKTVPIGFVSARLRAMYEDLCNEPVPNAPAGHRAALRPNR